MNLMHRIKRFYQQTLINLRHPSKAPRSTFEVEALKICRNLIHNPNAELLVCPDTDRRFIVCDALHVRIIIEDDKIILSNSTYRELMISERGIKSITRIFNGSVRTRRDLLEKQIKESAKTYIDDMVQVTSYLLNP